MSTTLAALRRQETGRTAVALGVALTLTWSVLDLLVSTGLGAVLGVGFVLTCVWLALTIRSQDFFVAAVLPPLLLAGVLLLTALLRPDDLTGSTALSRAVGALVDLRLALVLAWVGALAVLALRRTVATRSARSPRPRAAAPRGPRRTSPRPSSAPPGSPLPR